jgi:glucose/arabinose dehydrogenase
MKNKLYFIVGFTLIILVASPFYSANLISNQSGNLVIGDITGGFGRVSVEIKNTGDETVNDVDWNISITGGLLGLINAYNEDTIDSIEPDETVIINSKFFFGIGRINVEVNANNLDKYASGRILILPVTIFPEEIVEFDIVASGLNSPVVMANAGDSSNRLFIADQTGIINIIENDDLLTDPFLDITEKVVTLNQAYDERGLLGLTFHPDYENNGRFFVYYSAAKEGQGIDHESILSEYSVSGDPNIADPNSEKIIFRVDQPESNHNGGQIEFGPDGYLYIGLGDGGGAGDVHGTIGNGQDINTSLGSILRIDVDSEEPYTIPPDNPFVGSDGLDEIYSWGFRNPWKFSFDRDDGTLFVADVGQDEWEEIDIVENGINYGWRIMEGNNPYDPDLADLLGIDIETLGKPIHEYSHSIGKSITGGYVYRGIESPKLFGKYLFGDWSSSFVVPNGKIYYLEEVSPDVWERFELRPSEQFNRFVLSFGEDENGELYLLSKTTLGPTGDTGDVRRIIVN